MMMWASLRSTWAADVVIALEALLRDTAEELEWTKEPDVTAYVRWSPPRAEIELVGRVYEGTPIRVVIPVDKEYDRDAVFRAFAEFTSRMESEVREFRRWRAPGVSVRA